MPLNTIEVTTMGGEKSTWNISLDLGNLHRHLIGSHEDKESIAILREDTVLHASLVTMMWEGVGDMSSIARKDGDFGVLYRTAFNCEDSAFLSTGPVASRGRVMRRIQADITSEISLNRKFPRQIEFAIPDPELVEHHQVGLWAFVPIGVMHENGFDYDLLDDVVALLLE